MWEPLPTALDLPVGPPLTPARDHTTGRRLVHLVGAALGAAALGILLQLALAHPAGATTPPLSGLAIPGTSLVSGVASPVLSTVGQTGNGVAQGAGAASQTTTSVVQGVASAVQLTTTPLLSGPPLAPVLGAVTQPAGTVDDLLGGSAASLALPVGRPVSSGTGLRSPAGRLGIPIVVGAGTSRPTITVPTGASLVANPFAPVASAATRTVTLVLSALAAPRGFFTFALGATQGRPAAPQRPAPPLLPSPMGATSEAWSPAHGGGPLDALPPVSLLLPALIALGVLLGRQRNPLFLFDMRAAPPG
jgi:hypothetical protein